MEPAPAVDLAALIFEHRNRTGESYEKIAARGGMLRAHVWKIANRPVGQVPAEETLRRLAAGLQLPLERVVDAALVSVGIDLPDDGGRERREVLLEALVEMASGLSSENQRLLVGIASLLTNRGGGDGVGN